MRVQEVGIQGSCQVYYAPSLTEPATAEGGSWVPGYSTGNSNNVVCLSYPQRPRVRASKKECTC